MNKKKESQEAGAAVTGIAIIVGAIAHATRKKKWEEFHTWLVIIGSVLTIYGGAPA